MFEIPDDENFWEDFPLDDITNAAPQKQTSEPPASSGGREKRQLSNGDETASNDSSKKFRFKSPDFHRHNRQVSGGHTHLNLSQGRQVMQVQDSMKNIPQGSKSNAMSASHLPSRSMAASLSSPATTTHSAAAPHQTTPKRCKRKFPGPAGLLPKLPPGKSPEVLETSLLNRKTKSPEQMVAQEREDVVLSSQPGDELFRDTPWQTLLTELGEEGQRLMGRFSLASSLNKAKKKQLWRGKVAMAMCVIETIDCQGGDATVSLRDTTGRMHGTIHREVMKEHETELQQGTVIVLRQVSVISPTPRNHYLNITPSNLVALYTKCDSRMTTKHFVHQDQSLSATLTQTEKDFNMEEAASRTLTRSRVPGSHQATPTITSNSYPQTPRFTGQIRGQTPRMQGQNPQFSSPMNQSRMPWQNSARLSEMHQNRGQTPRVCGTNASTFSGAQRFHTPRTPGMSGSNSMSPWGPNRQQTPRFTSPSSATPRFSGTVQPHRPPVQPNTWQGNQVASRSSENMRPNTPRQNTTNPNLTSGTTCNCAQRTSDNMNWNKGILKTSAGSTGNIEVLENTKLTQQNEMRGSANAPSTPNRQNFKFKAVTKTPNAGVKNTENYSMDSSTCSASNNLARFSGNSAKNVVPDTSNSSAEFDRTVSSAIVPVTYSSHKDNTNPLPNPGMSGNSCKITTHTKPCFQVDSDLNEDLSDDLLSQLSDEMM